MRLTDLLGREFDLEMAYTRKFLERVPEDKFAWKPTGRGMTLGWLATFMAILPTWTNFILDQDSFDVAPPGGPPPRNEEATARAQLLELFDRNVSAARVVLAKAADERLSQPWSLLAGGKPLFSEARWLVIQTYVIHHEVHHRAQLGLYLKLLGIPVPAVYSGSGDEQGGLFMDR